MTMILVCFLGGPGAAQNSKTSVFVSKIMFFEKQVRATRGYFVPVLCSKLRLFWPRFCSVFSLMFRGAIFIAFWLRVWVVLEGFFACVLGCFSKCFWERGFGVEKPIIDPPGVVLGPQGRRGEG